VSDSQTLSARAGACVRQGLTKGARTTLWLLKFIIPISLGMMFLQQLGVLAFISRKIGPAFHLVGLSGEAALPFLAGALLNVYSGLAAVAQLDFTGRELTILCMMILISHNLPIEATVQHKSGSSGWRLVLLRLAMSAAGALVLHLLMPPDAVAPAGGHAAAGDAALSWAAALHKWFVETAWVTLKIALFASGVMVLQQFLEEFRVMPVFSRILAPPLALLGLPGNTVFLWVVANTLGLAYGAGVLLEETRSGRLSKRDIEIVNRSIAVCHSLLEDTLLCVAVGASAFWITLPRIALAAAVVWGYRLSTFRSNTKCG